MLYSNFSLAIYFTHGSVYMSVLLSPFHPTLFALCPPPPRSPQVHSLHLRLHLYSFPANWFISTNFLVSTHACVLSCFSCVRLCGPMDYIALQAPLSMRFHRQEYWSGLSCPPPGDLLHPGTEPTSVASLQLSHWGSP